jgi:hypothetical protein
VSRPAAASAFLALWNGIDDARLQPEYEAWHTFEHVPERVGLPGFLAARRYRRESPASPLYFTLYWLDAIGALDTPAYAAVFAAPTAWTARLRGHLNGFVRLPCALRGSHGLSSTSQLATLHLRLQAEGAAGALDEVLATCVRQGQVVAADWGVFAPTREIPIANRPGGEPPQAGRDAVVLLHGLDAAALQAQAQAGRIVAALADAAVLVRPPERYTLLTEVRREALPPPLAQRQLPRDDLRERFHPGDTP